MLPNIDPKQMEKMMRQMGIQSKELGAKRVIIELDDGKLIVEQPHVTQINMQGQTSFQIAGKVSREENISEDDITLIMEKTGCTREQAVAALKDSNGEIAEAIIKLESAKQE